MYTVKRYSEKDKEQWDQFISQSKNATFLFYRDFMDYHKDRFIDHSLLIFKDNKLVSVLPANQEGETVHSHQGLTYGGFILPKQIKLKQVIEIVLEALKHFHNIGISNLELKPSPEIFHLEQSNEIDYILFILNSNKHRVDVSSNIDLSTPVKLDRLRKRGIKKGLTNNLIVKEETKFNEFWNSILTPFLFKRHNTKPVHSLNEINLLAKLFPKNIRQYNLYHENIIVAGATIFETKQVAHVQYASSNDNRQILGSQDFLFDFLLKRYQDKKFFNFGISNENEGMNINEGLLYWKESFGARTITQEFHTIPCKNYESLKSIFI